MRGLIVLLAAAALGLVAGLWSWTRPGAPIAEAPMADGPASVPVHLVDNGFHTDLIVPRAALSARPGPLADAVAALPPGDWVRVGWGDARFFPDLRPIQQRLPDGARAFFAPGNASVVMLDPEPAPPRGGRTVVLDLGAPAAAALAARIEAALALEAGAARTVLVRAGDDARFLAGRETFSILRLCNHWTAAVLNAAGVTTRPAASAFSGQVMAAAALDSRARRD
ncbi:MAG TPA: DUF2459 domain-containing protein [Brevundimonas sp.]|jgi:hypothetical protein|uniref:DUF2459 domain-containing protein n=1 Tax=Brevundimonas sp. TaxID=1871086 RepID=UPI002E0ED23C|nr:DUF2459 domain-containing protein [Brevundimonas sp.]